MWTHPALPVLALLLLGVATFPVDWIHRKVLGLVFWTVQIALWVGLAGCGLFALRPEFLPTEGKSLIGPLQDLVGPVLPADRPEWIWVVAGGLLAVGSLPLLTLFHFARRLAAHAATMADLRQELDTAVTRLARMMEAAQAQGRRGNHPPEIRAATEAMAGALAAGTRSAAQPSTKLVRDYLRHD